MANARTRYDTILDYMVRRHEAVAGMLYGKPAALLHGEAFMAYHFDGMAFRLQGRARLKASTLAGAKYWDPRSGDTPSMNWISVPTAHFLRWDGFAIDAMHQIKDGLGKRPTTGAACVVALGRKHPEPARQDPDPATRPAGSQAREAEEPVRVARPALRGSGLRPAMRRRTPLPVAPQSPSAANSFFAASKNSRSFLR